jgi:SAM-dependent methyltransferase
MAVSEPQTNSAGEFYALTYDVSVPDWPGEIDFYRTLAAEAAARGGAVLELACGTGRVALHLLRDGVRLVGLDLSPAMLEVARQKAAAFPNARWVEADMRSFQVGETFELVIVPGHALHNLTTAEDHLACLRCAWRHLTRSGKLVMHLDHQSLSWLGELCRDKGGLFEPAEVFAHPVTGCQVRTLRAWSYEPSTQTATVQTVWEELEADGRVRRRWDSGPHRLHCFFRFEVQHLLARAGFAAEALYGDFFEGVLKDDSSEMVWVAGSSYGREESL